MLEGKRSMFYSHHLVGEVAIACKKTAFESHKVGRQSHRSSIATSECAVRTDPKNMAHH